MIEPVICLHVYTPHEITTEEYDQILKDVMARCASGLSEPGDRVLIHLLKVNDLRYEECKLIKKHGISSTETPP